MSTEVMVWWKSPKDDVVMPFGVGSEAEARALVAAHGGEIVEMMQREVTDWTRIA